MIKERRYGWGCTAFLSVFHKSSLYETCDGMLPLIRFEGMHCSDWITETLFRWHKTKDRRERKWKKSYCLIWTER